MSNSRNTSKARQARALARAATRAFNDSYHRGGDPTAYDRIRDQERKLAHSGVRYGNHRRWKAAEKVQGRRNERHTLNSNISQELDNE